MVAVFNFSIPQNHTLELTFQVNNTDGTPKDLTGWSAKMQIRESKASAVLLASYATVPDGSYLSISGLAGQVLVDVPGTVTATYDWEGGDYDLVVIDPSGKPYRVSEGNAYVNAGVTQL